MEVFKALDRYLRDNRMRFRELFDAFGAKKKGFLTPSELRLLVKELQPSAPEGDIKYFQVCTWPTHNGVQQRGLHSAQPHVPDLWGHSIFMPSHNPRLADHGKPWLRTALAPRNGF